jgi:eukaryotic-like serine/threonine-protein kinase
VCLWEALVGTRPFRGGTVAALVGAMRERPRPPIRHRGLLAVLARGLDPDPEKRWPDVAALARALDGAQRRRWWRAVLAAALIIALIALIALAIAWVTAGP